MTARNQLYPHVPNRGQCVESVSDGHRSFSWHQCHRQATKGAYCKQHHPDTVRERREQAVKRWEAKMERAPEVRASQYREALFVIATSMSNDPALLKRVAKEALE
jgi:hypothetical protein